MKEQPMNSIALGDGLRFNHKGIEHRISRIEYNDHQVVSTITPPHEAASKVVEAHIRNHRGIFSPETFLRELSDFLEMQE